MKGLGLDMHMWVLCRVPCRVGLKGVLWGVFRISRLRFQALEIRLDRVARNSHVLGNPIVKILVHCSILESPMYGNCLLYGTLGLGSRLGPAPTQKQPIMGGKIKRPYIAMK